MPNDTNNTTGSDCQERLVRRLRDSICNEENDGQLLEDAADRIEELCNALNQFYEVNTRFGIGGFGMMEYQKANHDARAVLFSTNSSMVDGNGEKVQLPNRAHF